MMDVEKECIRDNVANILLQAMLPVIVDDVDMGSLKTAARLCADKLIDYIHCPHVLRRYDITA